MNEFLGMVVTGEPRVCTGCGEELQPQTGTIIGYTDGRLYHLGCLDRTGQRAPVAQVRLERNDLVPALLRPGMYTGEQGDRTREQYLADAVIAYLGARRG